MKNSNSGIYILELFAEKEFSVSINKIKEYIFPIGFYYYIGSAQKNLQSRIKRHLQREKKIHWHIDHLTTLKSIKVISTFVILDAEKYVEAEIANNFDKYFNSEIAVQGFGNSDTKETKTHLFYSPTSIPKLMFQKHYLNLNIFLVDE